MNGRERLLEEANKLIFVKAYNEAEDILKQLVEGDEGYCDPLIQLRRIELAAKLDKLTPLRREFEQTRPGTESARASSLRIRPSQRWNPSVRCASGSTLRTPSSAFPCR